MLHYFEYTRSKVGSGVLLFYWLFEIVVSTIKLRTMAIIHREIPSQKAHFIIYTIEYILSTLIFVFECISKPRNKRIMLADDEDEVIA